MKIFAVDAFEFPYPSSEENVEIAIARRSQFPDVTIFVGHRISVEASNALPDPAPLNAVHGIADVCSHLHAFAGVAVPADCRWPVRRFFSGPDEIELVIEAPDTLLHYKWSSSA